MMEVSATAVKVRRLLLPMMAISTGFIAGYSLLNWLSMEKAGALPFDDNVADLWLPAVSAMLVVMLLIWPRLRLLQLDQKRNIPFFYRMTAVAVMLVPTLLAQSYVRTSTGAVTHLGDATDIATAPHTRFYVADRICMHINRPILHGFGSTSGKHDEAFDFDLYVLARLCSRSDETPIEQSVWLGIKYHTSMSSSASMADKESVYNEFVRDSLRRFDAEDPRQYRFLARLGRNADSKRYEQVLDLSGIRTAVTIVIPHPEPFAKRSGHRFAAFLGSLLLGWLVWFGLLSLVPLRLPSANGSLNVES